MTSRSSLGAPTVALLYRRVSTDEQAREGLSLAAQRADTRRYALRRGWIVGDEYQDVLSGTRDDRPGYLALLAEARQLRAADVPVVVVVKWLDRFGRSVLDRARRGEEFRLLRIPVHSTQEGGLLPDLVSNLLAAVAEEEVRRLRERVAASRRHVAAGGWYLPGGPPWGYRWRPATPHERHLGAPGRVLDVDPLQAPSVREAWKRVARGDSIRATAKWVQQQPAAARGGRHLGPPALRRILGSPVYIGRAPSAADGAHGPRQRWPALVSEAHWTRVQERIATFAPARRGVRPPALLVGLIRCQLCGARMQRIWQTRHAPQYACAGRQMGAGAPKPGCGGSAIAAEVDRAVLDAVDTLLAPIQERTPAQEAGLRQRWDSLRVGTPSVHATAGNEARERWAEAALRFTDGTVTRAHYRRIRDGALHELDQAENLGGPPSGDEQSNDIGDWARVTGFVSNYVRTLQEDDLQAKRAALRLLIEQVVPERIGWGKYGAAIQWTRLATAVRSCSGGMQPDA